MMTTTAVVSPSARDESMAEKNEKKMKNNCLPEEIIIEVLQRSSLTSLATVSCVSKLWHTLISTKTLIFGTPFSPPLQHGFLFQLRQFSHPTDRFPLHFFPTSPNAPIKTPSRCRRILAASNGLILFAKSEKGPTHHYSVWNPVSNRLTKIPTTKNCSFTSKIAFHSHDSVSFLIIRFGHFGNCEVDIFSSEKGRWGSLLFFNSPLDSTFQLFSCPPAAVLKGVFYWLQSEWNVYALDLLNNQVYYLACPPEETEYRRAVFFRCLAVAGGSVVMASTDGKFIEIWVLQEWTRSWDFKCRLSVETLAINNANILYASFEAAAAEAMTGGGWNFLGIVGFHPWDSERIYLNTTEMVVCCDVGSGKVEIVHRFDRDLKLTDVTDFTFIPYQSG